MGILYLVATPIGNLEDITIRAIKTLFSVDYIACEDTRRTGILIQNLVLRIKNQEFKIKVNKIPQFISYYDQIEYKRIPEILDLLLKEKNIALISDSGTPLISDPGFKLVRECIKRGIKTTTIPGPSAITSALSIAGLPTSNFLFLGFVPKNKNERFSMFQNIEKIKKNWQKPLTVVFFENPLRVESVLNELLSIFGDIEVVICRELTKIHEEMIRNKISLLLASIKKVKGEIVILFNLNS